MYHGTTLFQLWQILDTQVWLPGRWLVRPDGIRLAEAPSMAIDRANAIRGYAATQHPHGIPNGWDGPVAIGLHCDLWLVNHHATLANDVELGCLPVAGRTRVPLSEIPIVSVHIYEPLYRRLQKLHSDWPALLRGDAVLCRFKYGEPDFLQMCGRGFGWSCCRVTNVPQHCGLGEIERWSMVVP